LVIHGIHDKGKKQRGTDLSTVVSIYSSLMQCIAMGTQCDCLSPHPASSWLVVDE
jgi:hypothetical protein